VRPSESTPKKPYTGACGSLFSFSFGKRLKYEVKLCDGRAPHTHKLFRSPIQLLTLLDVRTLLKTGASAHPVEKLSLTEALCVKVLRGADAAFPEKEKRQLQQDARASGKRRI
jgi:hypothetical protein